MADDSSQPAAKADVQAVRGELKAVQRSLVIEIVKTNARMDQMEERINSRMDAGFSRVLESIDQFAAEAKHYRQADISRGHALVEVEIKMKDHDRRIAALESAPGRAQAP